MSTPLKLPSALMETIRRHAERVAILENRYFAALREREFERSHFIETQKQFYFAVAYFSRPMAALLARIPGSEARAALVHNLADEHGLADEEETQSSTFDPQLAHDRTFLRFLGTLGVSTQDVRDTTERATV